MQKIKSLGAPAHADHGAVLCACTGSSVTEHNDDCEKKLADERTADAVDTLLDEFPSLECML